MKRIIGFGFLTLVVATAFAAEQPRERLPLDFGWRFHLGDAPDSGNIFEYPEVKDLTKTHVEEVGLEEKLVAGLPNSVTANLGGKVSFAQPKFDDSKWRPLDLPHDWAVEMPFATNADLKHGFKTVGGKFQEDSIGWYRRELDLPASDAGRALWVEFDGVFRNSLVWLNGHCLGRNVSGYSSFRYDVSKYAIPGAKNELVVRVDASRFEGWFYEGAGIYRHVWLVKANPLHVAPNGIFVYSKFNNNIPEGPATVNVETRLEAPEPNSSATVRQEILSPEGKSVATLEQSGSPAEESKMAMTFSSPELWSPETPKLYKLITTIESGGKTVDRVETEFGIRTVAFDAEKGFLLNGKPYLIKGTCNHQDFAGVGTAMPDALQYYRVGKLKEMGCNAYRTSHNAPTPELLQACDRMGMLVMDENRRMDNTAQALDELKRLVLRDRNHPSVFIWSLGNEEFHLQAATPEVRDISAKIASNMQTIAHKLDPTRLCTIAMNAGWGTGFSTVIDVQGFNYHTGNIEKYHAKNPKQPSIGTETASTQTTRGAYADSKPLSQVAAYGERGTAKAWGWWGYFATHPSVSGGFAWTGFDYRGEPTPYKWPCVLSQFGIMDLCGFPKDLFYYYQSWWQEKPVLHLLPHWNWPGKEGQPVLVRCFSNCKEVELFLNGKSLGKQAMQSNQYLDWTVNYQPGVLSAKGYDGNKVILETKVETTGAPAAVRLEPDRTTIGADGKDVSVVNVCVLDSQGRVVPTADNLIQFGLTGPGKIIGVGNGNPASHEPDKAGQRSAFNGFAQVIIQSDAQPGEIQLTAIAKDLKSDSCRVRTE
jgi:beta-galactosidase